MKTPEDCGNSLRNRKQKKNVQETSEEKVKNLFEFAEDCGSLKKIDETLRTNFPIKKPTEMRSEIHKSSNTNDITDNRNFTIKIEFDPMSIALFTIAIVTRFFRLSEPRNVV